MAYTKEIIAKLKVVRKERGISYQDIVDATERNGCAVSLSTVKRVFSESSDGHEFRYETTIKPIARVLLGLVQDQELLVTNDAAQADALRSIVLSKDETIAALQARIQDMEKDFQVKATYLKRLVRILAIALALVVLAILVLLVADKLSPNIGWFRSAALYAHMPAKLAAFLP